MNAWLIAVAVGVGGGAGAMCRYGLVMLASRLIGGFPFGTLAVNVLGAFGIGVGFLYCQRRPESAVAVRAFAMTGFLGGFTTFSAFSLDSLALWQNGHFAMACAYILLSVMLCLAGALFAMSLTRMLL